jgi:hypothetical protein
MVGKDTIFLRSPKRRGMKLQWEKLPGARLKYFWRLECYRIAQHVAVTTAKIL